MESSGPTVPLLKHIEEQFKAVYRSIAANRELSESTFKASQIAIDKFEEADKARRVVDNEWRGESKDRQATYPTKSDLEGVRKELLAHIDRNTADLQRLDLSRATLEGKASQKSVGWATAAGAIGIGLSVLSILLKFIN